VGSDIHMLAEVRRDGEWEPVGRIFPDAYYESDQREWWACRDDRNQQLDDNWHPEHVQPHTGFCWSWNAPITNEPWHERHYPLFALLSDTRNHDAWGIVPLQTWDDDREGIEALRGIPDDASAFTRTWIEDNADHSITWLSLAELERRNQEPIPNPVCPPLGLPEAWNVLLDRLRPLGAPDDVRIVFGYDS
jgi:hypothetical protein